MSDFIKDLRDDHHDFDPGKFEISGLKNPWVAFEKWNEEALQAGVNEPNAMNVATVDQNGQPSARIVYLKDILNEKLVFYTNYNSAKAKDMQSNQRVCLSFFWPEMSRQIRIYGTVEKTAPDVSDRYFASRPYESQIGAWASDQSQKLMSKSDLEGRLSHLSQLYPTEVPRPPHWGGFQVTPDYFEFWQGQPSRLHDRLVFQKQANDWTKQYLNP